MIEINCAQGTSEWKRARAGVITASIFKDVRGKATDGVKDMAFRLAVERISGDPLDEGHGGWAAQRGIELEPEARLCHQEQISARCRQVGFALLNKDRWFGCSADSLIDRDASGKLGGGEYKCFVDPAKCRKIIMNHDYSDIEDQAQGCLWITHREFWDMCLYCPALAPVGQAFFRHRIWRNDDHITDMVDELMPFQRMVEDYEGELRRRGLELGFNPPVFSVCH